MTRILRWAVPCLPLLVLVGCSGTGDPLNPATTGGAVSSANAVLFDPTTGNIPLPNVLATATAADPLAGRAANTPMTPPEALAYINLKEMGGTNAVAGLNAPIYLRFTSPVDASTVSAANIRVFQLSPDAAGTENAPLGFTDVTGLFNIGYTAGSTDLFLTPKFPLLPGTRYLYVVSSRVKDLDSGGSVISSVYFNALKATAPLTGSLAPLEAIRADVMAGSAIKLSGYAKVMDDLIAASATTGISSRADIALMGRFITTGAGFVFTDPVGAPTAKLPVETALRSFAAGAPLGGLSGKTWTNSITVTATFTKGDADPTKTTDAYWKAVAGASATAPASVGQVVLGTFNSAELSLDPVVVGTQATAMDQTAVAGAYNPAAGVVQAFRDATGKLTGYYHVAKAIPFIYIAPDAAAPSGGYPLVLFQHGITAQKENVLGVAQSLTTGGRAVLAFDLPLHGARQVSGHTNSALWGQDFMAIGAPLATRSNIQQAAFDLHRAQFTVMTGGFATLGAKAPALTGMRFVGHSLGSIVGAYYLAGNTTLSSAGAPYTQATLDADMKGYLSVPGGNTAYLIQASPAFGHSVNAGLAAKGIAQGTPTYHQFFQVTQSVVDSVDPAAMTTPLAAGLPSRLSGRIAIQESVGDQVIGNAYTRYFANGLGGREVLGTAGAAIGPNFKQLGYAGGAAPRIPATFLFTLNGSTPAPKVAFAALTAADTAPKEGYFQFDQAGIGHSSLLDPTNPANAALIQKQMLYFLGVTGNTIVVDPTQSAPGLPVAPGPNADVKVPAVYEILGF